jgi:hypothetical protein
MEWLQVFRVRIKNDNLDSVETSVFGWMLAAHDSMVFRPALKNRLTALIKSLLVHILNKAITNYGTPEDRVELPELFVNSKWQSFCAPPKRVQSHPSVYNLMRSRCPALITRFFS